MNFADNEDNIRTVFWPGLYCGKVQKVSRRLYNINSNLLESKSVVYLKN